MKKLALLFLFLSLVYFSGCSDKGTVSTTVIDNVSPKDFLTSDNYDQLVIEIQYVPGYQPSDAAINNISTFLQSRLNKPNGVSFVKTPVSALQNTYSISDVKSLEAARRTQKTSGRILTVYFFFANGDYDSNPSDSKVLGITYDNASIVVFQKTINDFSGGPGQPTGTVLETIVMQHEFGHLMGLVDRGTPLTSQHLDAANGKHCTDVNCVMFYNVETSNVLGNFFGGNIPQLTKTCLDDLKANGGK